MPSTLPVRSRRPSTLILLGALAIGSGAAALPPAADTNEYSLGTAFTWQGRLERNGTPAEGRFDVTFELYDAREGGAALGRIDRFDVPVREGAFAAELDFGSVTRGEMPVWLEISVRAEGEGAYVALSPRSRLAGDSLGLCTVNSDVLINGSLEVDAIGPTVGMSIACCNEADLDGGGQLRLAGSLNDLLLDANELQARSLLQGGAFYLNPHGGNVGVGIESGAAAPLHLPSGPDVQVGGGGALVVGSPSGVSLAIDQNEIMVRNGGATSTLHLQADGGTTVFGGLAAVGLTYVESALGTEGTHTVDCPSGLSILGGGCRTADSIDSPDALVLSLPFTVPNHGWLCRYDSDDMTFVTAYAICARLD